LTANGIDPGGYNIIEIAAIVVIVVVIVIVLVILVVPEVTVDSGRDTFNADQEDIIGSIASLYNIVSHHEGSKDREKRKKVEDTCHDQVVGFVFN